MYDISEIGKKDLYLGVSILESKDHIFLHQWSFVEKIIWLARIDTAIPLCIPLFQTHCLYDAPSVPTDYEAIVINDVPFKEIIGSLLLLLTRTTPDFFTGVFMLGKVYSDPFPEH